MPWLRSCRVATPCTPATKTCRRGPRPDGRVDLRALPPRYSYFGTAIAGLAAPEVAGAGRWFHPYPHPYFVSKFLVFLSLWVWLRGKIVTIKKFPAKSSRIRSYVDDRGRGSGIKRRRTADNSEQPELELPTAFIVRRRDVILCNRLSTPLKAGSAVGSGARFSLA